MLASYYSRVAANISYSEELLSIYQIVVQIVNEINLYIIDYTSKRVAPPSVTTRTSAPDAGRSAAQTPATHEVLNQSKPLDDYNAFSCDPSLVEAMAQHGATWAEERISALGMCVGSVV